MKYWPLNYEDKLCIIDLVGEVIDSYAINYISRIVVPRVANFRSDYFRR